MALFLNEHTNVLTLYLEGSGYHTPTFWMSTLKMSIGPTHGKDCFNPCLVPRQFDCILAIIVLVHTLFAAAMMVDGPIVSHTESLECHAFIQLVCCIELGNHPHGNYTKWRYSALGDVKK